MCWRENGGQAILTFRALLQSNLFDAAWGMLNKDYFSDVKLPKNIILFPTLMVMISWRYVMHYRQERHWEMKYLRKKLKSKVGQAKRGRPKRALTS